MTHISNKPPFQASYSYGPAEQRVKVPHPITAFFNSIMVRLLKVFLFPGASILKGRYIDAKRIAESKEDLKALGAESVKVKTPDGDTLDCLYLDAEKFKASLEKYFKADSYIDDKGATIPILRLKDEYTLEVQEKTKNSSSPYTYREPLQEVQEFLNKIQGIVGQHIPYKQLTSENKREYIIELAEASSLQASSPAATALIIHGSGMTSTAYKGLAGDYLMRGINVMLADLRGYGKSQGSPTDFRTKLDLDSVYQYLQKEKHVKNEELLVHAHCISGAPATDLAARRPGVNILLDRTFADFTDVAVTRFPLISRIVRFIMPYILDFNSAKNLPKIKGHIAIEMDQLDETIPADQVTKLINNLPYRKGQVIKLMDSNIGHGGTWTTRDKTQQQFDRFLEQIHFGRKLF